MVSVLGKTFNALVLLKQVEHLLTYNLATVNLHCGSCFVYGISVIVVNKVYASVWTDVKCLLSIIYGKVEDRLRCFLVVIICRNRLENFNEKE